VASDTASDTHPDGVTMLYCVKTPDVGGDTTVRQFRERVRDTADPLRDRIEVVR